jgi:hypothetical protein
MSTVPASADPSPRRSARAARLRALLTAIVVILAIQLARQAYSWVVYRDERAQLTALRVRVVDAGAELIRARAKADSVRTAIEAEDGRLAEARRGLDAWGRHARDGTLPGHLYASYRRDLDDFNRRVEARNERAAVWHTIAEERRTAAVRYDALADSIRAIARRIGDPYYAVPLPAEAAAERGIAPPQLRAGG